jgi:hypothetical protein
MTFSGIMGLSVTSSISFLLNFTTSEADYILSTA